MQESLAGTHTPRGCKPCEHDANHDYTLSGNDQIREHPGGTHDEFFLADDVHGDDEGGDDPLRLQQVEQ